MKLIINIPEKMFLNAKEESKFGALTEGLERALDIIDKYNLESEE